MYNEKQVMEKFYEIKQLGTTTVDFSSLTEQEEPVPLEQLAKAKQWINTDGKVEEIQRKYTETVKNEPQRVRVMFSKLIWNQNKLTVSEESCTTLN